MKKNNYTYIGISFIVLVFGIIFIPRIIERIKGGTVVENELAYITFEGAKKKVPEFAFVNQDSIVISNRDYLGKVFVVEFFFTKCGSICPIMTRNLVDIQDEFKDFENFGLASFSISPEQDTPTVLKEYAEKYNIVNLDWHLMTGNKAKIYELANKGFNIFAAENPNVPDGFEHSGMFALIDKKGFIRSRMDGHGNPLIYYRGVITQEDGQNDEGETEQISILKEDIKKLLTEK